MIIGGEQQQEKAPPTVVQLLVVWGITVFTFNVVYLCKYLKRLEEVESYRAGMIGSCEPPDWVLGQNWGPLPEQCTLLTVEPVFQLPIFRFLSNLHTDFYGHNNFSPLLVVSEISLSPHRYKHLL